MSHKKNIGTAEVLVHSNLYMASILPLGKVTGIEEYFSTDNITVI